MYRSNRSQAPMESFLVSKSNQAIVVSGDLNTAGTSLNIADGQLGVLSADPNGTVKPGNFIPAGTTTTDVKAIEIVQGTPNSSQTTEVNAFGIGHKAIVKSGIIQKDKIRSVATYKYEHPRYSIWYLRTLSNLDVNIKYYMNITLEGERIDTTHGMNREVIRCSTSYATAPTNAADYVLQNLGLKVNQMSKFVNPNTNYAGTKPIIAFGVKSANGSGQIIGNITKASSFNFAKYTVGGTAIQSTYKADLELVNSLKTAIGSVAGLATATIENLGNVTPGSAATIDGLVIIAFREKEIAAYDDVKELSIRADVNFGAEIGTKPEKLPTYTLSHVCTPSEGVNTGRQVALRYADRAEQQIFTLQNWPIDGRPYPVPESYLSKTGKYTVTIIEYFDNDNVISGEHEFVKTAVICLPAAISDDTVSASTGLTINTTDTNTVSSLNSTLRVWINSNANVQYLGSATANAIFV